MNRPLKVALFILFLIFGAGLYWALGENGVVMIVVLFCVVSLRFCLAKPKRCW